MSLKYGPSSEPFHIFTKYVRAFVTSETDFAMALGSECMKYLRKLVHNFNFHNYFIQATPHARIHLAATCVLFVRISARDVVPFGVFPW